MQPKYPDIADILAAKEQRRRALAALSWEDKVAIVERMRELMPRGMWGEKTSQVSKTCEVYTVTGNSGV